MPRNPPDINRRYFPCDAAALTRLRRELDYCLDRISATHVESPTVEAVRDRVATILHVRIKIVTKNLAQAMGGAER